MHPPMERLPREDPLLMGLITPSPELAALLARCHANSAPLSAWEREFLDELSREATASPQQEAMLERIAGRHDPAAISTALAGRMADLATLLVGEEGVKASAQEMRFRTHGSLSVMIGGPNRGKFHDHEAGEGGDGIRLIQHLRRCSFAEALGWAGDWLGITPGAAAPPPPGVKPDPVEQVAASTEEKDRKLAAAQRIWQQGVAPTGTLVEAYLAARGLRLPPDAPLRFHGRCPRGREGERLPAMLALMTDPLTSEPVGLHRTYLRPDGSGKADGQAKMMLGGAGIVRLQPDDAVAEELGAAEGIETSLALMQIARWRPVWACVSAGGIARLPVIPGVQTLTIFPDNDDDGKDGPASRKAAVKARKRWLEAERRVVVWMPPKDMDWHDALTRSRA